MNPKRPDDVFDQGGNITSADNVRLLKGSRMRYSSGNSTDVWAGFRPLFIRHCTLSLNALHMAFLYATICFHRYIYVFVFNYFDFATQFNPHFAFYELGHTWSLMSFMPIQPVVEGFLFCALVICLHSILLFSFC